MKKLLIVLSLLLCYATAFPQREGFFNVYEQAEKSFCASAAIETDDGCFIIAVYDYYGGGGELKKLSGDGTMLKRLPISDDNVFSGIEGLYRDPWHTDSFYAIGHDTLGRANHKAVCHALQRKPRTVGFERGRVAWRIPPVHHVKILVHKRERLPVCSHSWP